MMKALSIVEDIEPGGLFEQLVYPPAFLERQRQTRFKQEWKISQFMYEQMMREWNGPRYQRGSVSMTVCANAAQQGAAGGGNVVLTAHKMSTITQAAITNSRIVFHADGRLGHQRGVNVKFRSSVGAGSPHRRIGSPDGEWWDEEPVTGSPAVFGNDYVVRHLSSGKTGTYNVQDGVADQWIAIASPFVRWGNNRTAKAAPGTTTTVATFEIADDAGSPPGRTADDSAVITIVSKN